ncbi:MAG: hypothetical protein V5B31_08400 [Candidatus Accumulibacter propinquus]|jgi:hypothetical protein|uniref:hypothetical protein n=1 Tax=Candidatus Accumulibacter propinquus TaxID=2954380 RepID=UPI002FC3DED1
MSDPVVAAAQSAFAQRLRDSSDVSDNTRNAQAIAKAWRTAVYELDPDRYQIEVLVAPDLDQKIDVLDTETHTAYEFKVSGKNATGEFYKDIVKVIVWNRKRKRPIGKLVFVTEEEWGRKYPGQSHECQRREPSKIVVYPQGVTKGLFTALGFV